ncbi:MAG: SAM-dependent methyltransferase [Saprospirales bacterium]|nr:SAM-dependent methyltransferase [Saprospirales bacterium]
MEAIKSLIRFLRYYFRAHTWYRVHSPFVYDFAEAVLEDDRWYYAFSTVETRREHLLRNRTKLELTDYGAGPRLRRKKKTTVAALARNSACRPEVGRWLFRMVNHFKPATVLELGTSLGISTAYQAAAAPNAKFISIEGDPASANVAKESLRLLGISSVEIRQGRFEDELLPALKKLEKLDYLFVDGNHRKTPTLDYFQQCLPFAHEGSVFVFDDIHWSAEMEEAWAQIKAHPKVSLSIDLFFIGVVFFRKEKLEKEHFTLIPWSWKPWAVGWGDFF